MLTADTLEKIVDTIRAGQIDEALQLWDSSNGSNPETSIQGTFFDFKAICEKLSDANDRKTLIEKLNEKEDDYLYNLLVKEQQRTNSCAIRLQLVLNVAPEIFDFITSEQLKTILFRPKNLHFLLSPNQVPLNVIQLVIEKVGGRAWLQEIIKTADDLEKVLTEVPVPALDSGVFKEFLGFFGQDLLSKLIVDAKTFYAMTDIFHSDITKIALLIDELGGAEWIKSIVHSAEDFYHVFAPLWEQDQKKYILELGKLDWFTAPQDFIDVCERFSSEKEKIKEKIADFLLESLGGVKWIERFLEIPEENNSDDIDNICLIPDHDINQKNIAKMVDQFSSNSRVGLLKNINTKILQRFVSDIYGHLGKFFTTLPNASVIDFINKFESAWLQRFFNNFQSYISNVASLSDLNAQRALLQKVDEDKSLLYNLINSFPRDKSPVFRLCEALLCFPEALDFLSADQLQKIISCPGDLRQLFLDNLLPVEVIARVINATGGNEWLQEIIRNDGDLIVALSGISDSATPEFFQSVLGLWDQDFLRKLISNSLSFNSVANAFLQIDIRRNEVLIDQLGGAEWIKIIVKSPADFLNVFHCLFKEARENYMKEMGVRDWLLSLDKTNSRIGIEVICDLVSESLASELRQLYFNDVLLPSIQGADDIKKLDAQNLRKLPVDIIYKHCRPEPQKKHVTGFLHKLVHSSAKAMPVSSEGCIESEIIFFHIMDYLAGKSTEKGSANQANYKNRMNDFAEIIFTLKQNPNNAKVALVDFLNKIAPPATKIGSADRYGELRRELPNLSEELLNIRGAEFIHYVNNVETDQMEDLSRKTVLAELNDKITMLTLENLKEYNLDTSDVQNYVNNNNNNNNNN